MLQFSHFPAAVGFTALIPARSLSKAPAKGFSLSSTSGGSSTLSSSSSLSFPDSQKHKFLGGSQTSRGDIYAMPSHSSSVLHIDPSTSPRPILRRITPRNPFDTSKFKWLRAVRTPDSSTIIGLPCWADSVLKIDTSTNVVSTFGEAALDDLLPKPPSSTRWNWHGGQINENGYVYAVPANAERVLKVHPTLETVSLVGPKFTGASKWYGGILDNSGDIWCVPYGHDRVLKISPGSGDDGDDEVREVGPKYDNVSDEGNANYGWHGGVYCEGNDSIYAFPAHAASVLKIRCGEDAVETVGEGLFGNAEYKVRGSLRSPRRERNKPEFEVRF